MAGPEEFDEEDNDKLPIDLQYLGGDKCRERDPDIRKIIVEALTQVSIDSFKYIFFCFFCVKYMGTLLLSSFAQQSLDAR